jgi:outer membrane receptor for ferric coprogen and ferric-rhodotorulic acid
MKYWKPGRYGLAFTTALALGAIPAFGQDAATTTEQKAPATTEAKASDEEVVELSPFVVETSKDVGYLATNSISGTRLNMAIKDVPMNLEVITSKFIQDTGATNLRDALRYSSGIVLQSQCDAFDNSGSGDYTVGYGGATTGSVSNKVETCTRTVGDSTTKMRGTENSYTLQNGFHRVYWDDTINVERVEVLRGPSSLLYGSGCTGGVINFITKKAIFDKEMYHFGVTLGTDALYRAELDVNMPLVSPDSPYAKYKPAVRIVSAWEQAESEVDYYKTSHWQTNLMLSFKPFVTTTVDIDGEFGYKKEEGNGFQNIRNETTGGTNGQHADWVTDIRTYDADIGLVNVSHNPSLDYRTMNWSGPDCYTKGPYSSITAQIEQKIGEDCWVKLGYMHSRAEFNSRQIVTTLTTNGGATGLNDGDTYTSVWTGETYTSRGGTKASDGTYSGGLYSHYVTGTGYFNYTTSAPTEYDDALIAYYWTKTEQTVDRDQLRAEATYKLDLDQWGSHTFIAGATYEKVKTTWDIYQPATTWSETSYDENGEIVALTGGSHDYKTYDQYSYKSLTDYSPFTYGTQGDGIADNPSVYWENIVENDFDLAYYACYQGQFLNDKLTVVGGIRWDRYDFNKTVSYPYCNSLVGGTDPYGTAVTIGKVDEVYNTSIRGGDGAITDTTPQFGISYAITNWLSVFAVASSGTMPNYYALDGNGQLLDPEKTKDYELGLKFDLFDGQLSGTISVYRLERENVPYFIWWAPALYKSTYSGYQDVNGDGTTDVYDMQMRLAYSTPDGWYDMFCYYASQSKYTENGANPYDTCLKVMESIYTESWWPYIEDVYNYAKSNSATLATGYANHATWSWSDFSTRCGDAQTSWSELSASATNSNSNDVTAANAAIDAGDTYFFDPMFRVTDLGNGVTADEVLDLLNSLAYNTTWTGNPYSSNNGTYYLCYDPNTNQAISVVNNTMAGNGAYVGMNDKANGWDMNLTWTTKFGLQMTASFSHLQRKVTTKRYEFVKTSIYIPGAQWLKYQDSLTGNLTSNDIYGDLADASTYFLDSDGNPTYVSAMYGKSIDDSPENSASLWAHYELSFISDQLKGWSVGLGGQWQDERMWFNGFSNGNTSTYSYSDDTSVLYLQQKWTKERFTVNAMVDYTTTFADKYTMRYALNVDNVLNDKDEYGNIYANGLQAKISVSLDF